MDIQKWLQDTVDVGGPSPRNRPDPVSIVAPTTNAVEHHERRSRKRKKSADSSLIEPQQAHHRNTRVRHRSPGTEDLCASSGCSSSHSNQQSDDAESHYSEDKPYQRRKRRKIRPDRYDEKPAKTVDRERSKGKKKDGNVKDRKRSRKKGKDATEATVVKDYKAKNVSATRLTLPSKLNIGLFKKGRASSPFRARGVPDLAFSEMKFLQKRRESTEDEPAKESKWTKRKRNRERAAEQEISAYFAPKKSVLADRDANVPSKVLTKSAKERHDDRTDKFRPIADPLLVPSIELPARPFLGFGSSGPRPQPRHHSRSTTYFTWSESVRRPSVPPHPQPNTISVGELKIPPIQAKRIAWKPAKPTAAAFVSQIPREAGKYRQKDSEEETKQSKKGQLHHEHQSPRQRRSNHPDLQPRVESRSTIPSNTVSSRNSRARQQAEIVNDESRSKTQLHLRSTTTGDFAGVERSREAEGKSNRLDEKETAAQRESTPLAELLNQCEQSAAAVQQPVVRINPSPAVASPYYGGDRWPWTAQQENSRTEGPVDAGSRSLGFPSYEPVPDLYPELRELDYGMAIEEDPYLPGETYLSTDADGRKEARVEADVGSIKTDGLNYEYEYEYETAIGGTDDLDAPVENENAALDPDDLLLSASFVGGQHVFGDWYEDVQDEEQVPADFWRPNKLY